MNAAAVEHPERGAPLIPVEQIEEADSHVRKQSWGDLDEFAGELAAHGQHVAALIRPLGRDRYEVIDGARRRRALIRAVELGLLDGPAFLRSEVRTMTDAEAHEARLATAIQREDLSPMEQAEAFAAARDVYQRSVEQIAASIKRSTAYVYQHLRLLKLEAPLRALSERLSMRSLLLLAQLPAKAQREAADTMKREAGWRQDGYGGVHDETPEGSDSGPFIGSSYVEDVVCQVSMLLKNAPFDTSDPAVVSKAGACTSCPKRTGAQVQLFEATDRHDLCLDVACWDKKVEAFKKVATKARQAEGLEVLSAEQASKALSYHGGYVRLDDKPSYDAKSTWGEVLGADTKPVVAFDERGREVLLAPSDVAHQALAASSPKTKTKTSSLSNAENDWKRDAAKAKQKEADQKEARRRAMAALVAYVERADGGGPEAYEFRRQFVGALIQGSWADVLKEVCKRRRWDFGKSAYEETIMREMADLSAPEIAGLMVEIVATRTASYTGAKPGFLALCTHVGIDVKHYEREVATERREKRKTKAPAAKAAAKRGRAKATQAAPTKDEDDLDQDDLLSAADRRIDGGDA